MPSPSEAQRADTLTKSVPPLRCSGDFVGLLFFHALTGRATAFRLFEALWPKAIGSRPANRESHCCQ